MSYFEKAVSSLKLPQADTGTQGAKIYNAAHEYLYNAYKEKHIDLDKKILVVNDDAGVLASLLISEGATVVSVHDSLLAIQSYMQLLESNRLDAYKSKCLPTHEFYSLEESLSIDVVLINIPANVDYLKEQLGFIKKHIHADTILLSSGMIKHISPHVKEELQKALGGTKASRVVKKAILFPTTPSSKLLASNKAEKKVYELALGEYGNYKSYCGVFSGQKLDQGTRLLLESLPNDLKGVGADLGCGYGIISKVIVERCPGVSVLYATDVSSAAVESTKLNVSQAKVLYCSGLESRELKELDFVISNPPFHSQSQLNVKMMHRLIHEVYDALKVGGCFQMVGNKGMKHGQYLHKVFKSVERVASNSKYEVYRCIKE